MNLNEKIVETGRYAGCADKISMYDSVIDALKKSSLKNVAVIGSIGSGKTTLINKLAGTKVRKPSAVLKEEAPLMVTFGSDEEKDDFVKFNVENQKLGEAGIALYEIPLDKAIDLETGEILKLLEEMDMVIYIISVFSPLTASDIRVLDTLTGRFPVFIFTSKYDMIEDEERESVESYIISSLSGKYSGAIFGYYCSYQERFVDNIIESLSEADTDELREFHIAQIENIAKEAVIQSLRVKQQELNEKRDERRRQQSDNDIHNRDRELEWDEIRVSMMQKESEAEKCLLDKTAAAQKAVRGDVLANLSNNNYDAEWIKSDLKPFIENRVNTDQVKIMKDVSRVVDAHAAWLISEVGHKFGVDIDVEYMENKSELIISNTGDYDGKRSYKKLALAIGSGALAGSAIVSGLAVLPTVAITVPLGAAMFGLLMSDANDQAKYRKKMADYACGCCGRTYTQLKNKAQSALNAYYDKLMMEIKKLCSETESTIVFSDIDSEEAELNAKLNEISII